MANRLTVYLPLGALLAVLLLASLGGDAADDRSGAAGEPTITDDDVVIKHEAGHQWLLPRDWPIERKDGVFKPAAVEEYLSMKFDQVKSRFTEIDGRLDRLGKRLEQLEADQKVVHQRLRLLEERAQAAEQVPSEGNKPADEKAE